MDLSKRAQNLLARLKAGDFYVTSSDRTPKAMEELEKAGLVGTMGRVAEIVRCWVPAGAQPFRLDRMEPAPQHLVMGTVGMYDDRSVWPAALFDRKDDAEGFVALMTDLGAQAKLHKDAEYDPPGNPYDLACDAAKMHDPRWDFDYNQPAKYTIVEMFPR